jgi:serine/threonine protein phosphatase PrpC
MAATRRRRSTAAISGAGATHDGHVRTENEDVIVVRTELGLYAVLDGMGGGPSGEVAAELASEVIATTLQCDRSRRRQPRQALEQAIKLASSVVFVVGEKLPNCRGMGTTAVACLIASPMRAVIGHLGDSRAYLLRAGKLVALTRDHSVVQELIDAGDLSHRAATRHPKRHAITRSVGGSNRPDMIEQALKPGDRLLLCSDGLHGYTSESSIRRVLAGKGTPDEIARGLVELALRSSTPDNVSAVVIEVNGGRAPAAAARRRRLR